MMWSSKVRSLKTMTSVSARVSISGSCSRLKASALLYLKKIKIKG